MIERRGIAVATRSFAGDNSRRVEEPSAHLNSRVRFVRKNDTRRLAPWTWLGATRLVEQSRSSHLQSEAGLIRTYP